VTGKWSQNAFMRAGPSTRRRRTVILHLPLLGLPKREAEAELNQLLAEAGRCAHLAARFLELNADRLSPTTVRGYHQILDRYILPALGSTKVRALQPADLDEFYARLLRSGGAGGGPLSAQSVHHVHALLRRLLNQASKWGWCAVSPAAKASPPRVTKHEIQPPAPEEVQKLLLAASERDEDLALFLRLAVVTGARRGELCALRWRDVDLDRRVLSIARSIVGDSNGELIEKDTKTHASRRVALDPETLDLLRSRLRSVPGRRVAADRGESLRSNESTTESANEPDRRSAPHVDRVQAGLNSSFQGGKSCFR
jgi:integrase